MTSGSKVPTPKPMNSRNIPNNTLYFVRPIAKENIVMNANKKITVSFLVNVLVIKTKIDLSMKLNTI